MSNDVFAVDTFPDRVERLSQYDISPVETVSARPLALPTFDELKPDRASVVGDGVLAFVSGMSSQNQQDIQHSYLFATLAANKKFPGDKQRKERYFFFLQVMQDYGWLILKDYYDSTSASGQSFKMDQLALQILASVLATVAVPGPSSALMLKVAGDAIKALQSTEKPLQLFERNVKDSGTGGFGLASCIENPGGEVIMALGVVNFTNKSNQTRVLFVDWNSGSVDLYRGECYMTMVPTIVNKTRDMVAQKLGDRAALKIAEYVL